MSSIEIAMFTVLWVLALALLILVVSLYRLVDKAYSGSGSADLSSALPTGSVISEIDVLGPTGATRLDVSTKARTLLVFAKSQCAGCESLVPALREFGGDAIVLLLEGERYPRHGSELPSNVAVAALAYPEDTSRELGVLSVPLVYALDEGNVMAVGSPTTKPGLDALLEAASKERSSRSKQVTQ